MVTKEAKIYIAGHRGMVGSAVWRLLESKGYSNLIGKMYSLNTLREFSILYFNKNEKDVIRCRSILVFFLSPSFFPLILKSLQSTNEHEAPNY